MGKFAPKIERGLEAWKTEQIAEEYSRRGYSIYKNHRLPRQGGIVDLYAYNKETGDRVIFEIKARKSIRGKEDLKRVLDQRNRYLEAFPQARFVLAIAERPKEPEITPSDFDKMLLTYLVRHKEQKIRQVVEGYVRSVDVTDVKMSKVDFNDFRTINIEGSANYRFIILTEKELLADQIVEQESLSDGIPFDFKVTLVSKIDDDTFDGLVEEIRYRAYRNFHYYINENNSEVKFDFSEFKTNS